MKTNKLPNFSEQLDRIWEILRGQSYAIAELKEEDQVSQEKIKTPAEIAMRQHRRLVNLEKLIERPTKKFDE